ncbi:MAG: type II CRISPR-associated endonuclease Cas1 [Atopobiaceae bacterium]|jgi:CRISPR-associated protein Cas1|nr:type II CRISPR-associated endonuclease Cas1 [Atopobiaceae bacterium]MCH4181444.1 type II CRISPR-associated endonuclease Cas1 [Atopobiaceae bacterium]MCH4213499.1 type II CRISPR-associated endonuclease Cas1 [Atopobiaceae bacterium]MCH4229721.1 type II CRISPR-associated endonuclease Cas1 [Atopobiaceae bacterium]MCI1226475.1 type II CRISPR-associated endonuclease Cas1 [Atopobiaceae bacterium]
MPKRTICIQSPAKLSACDKALLIIQDERQVRVPFEDIWVVILETHQAQITTAALSQLADGGIGVMLCGDDHMPNGLFLPLGAHSRHADIVENQLAISKPMQKRLWQRIVKAKITNQASVLELCGKSPCSVGRYVAEVKSGDTDNREGAAAAAYFKELIDDGNRRIGPYSGPLNYGYNILRAGVARAAVAGGWLVSRGLNHHNELNAFNLVDDLIEPFRPLVDLIVVKQHLAGDLTHEKKIVLASVFERLVKLDGRLVTSQTAIELMLVSLKAAVYDADYSELLLPSIVPLQMFSDE